MASNETNIRVAIASDRFLNVIDQEGIQPLIRCASEIFHAPVLLTDQLFHIRTAWPTNQTGIADLDNILASAKLESSKEWEILDENLSGKEAFYSPFYTENGSCADLPRMYGELVWNKEVRGHVIVYYPDKTFVEEDKEILEKLIRLLCMKLHRNRMGLDTWTATLQAKLELLLDPASPRHVRKPAVEVLQKEIKGGYGIMVTAIGQRASQKAFADYAVEQIQQRFRNIVVLVYDQAIVTLFGEVKHNSYDRGMRPETNQLIAWLFKYFEQYDMVSGISDYFDDINDLYLHYRRAYLTAIMIEQMGGTKHGYFTELMPLPMIGAVLLTETADTFMHPALHQIQVYDAENNTDFFHTLFVYATSLFDKDKASSALNIHKNTLVYRISRISDLFDVDLNEDATRLNLTLSCYLYQLDNGRKRIW